MAILVQREFQVAPGDRIEFERQGREGRWQTLQHLGAQMAAYGHWAFGGDGDRLVEHTVFEDMAHWEGAQPGGAQLRDPAIAAEVATFAAQDANRSALIASSVGRLFDLDDLISPLAPFRRAAGMALPALPPTFGVGSMISERTLALAEGTRAEFHRLTVQAVWPWLESQGGRGIAFGHDLTGPSNEVTTWFAFRSIAEWYRLGRPQTAHAPDEVVAAFNARQALVRHQRGRLLLIDSAFGQAV